MNILNLTLKKVWFSMIQSGEKVEEYREIKPYWESRLKMCYYDHDKRDFLYRFKHFDIIRFTNGYGKNAPTFDIECKGISIGFGRTDWGGCGETFIISLGKIIN